MNATYLPRLLICALAIALPGTAFAHSGHDLGTSLTSGFLHPLTGPDHVLAMVAVGLWAAMSGKPAIWAWPSSFLAAMIGGFVLAATGFALPFVEPMILASVIALGLMTALAFRPSLPLATGLIALFGLFHGFAHGSEAGGASLTGFGGGFIAATIALHLAGIALGLGLSRFGPSLARMAGLAVAGGGLFLAFGG
jgi:urease accessory protein